jgi:hypothetical protein
MRQVRNTSIVHRRPLVNGYGSYFPPEMPRRLALARRLPDVDAIFRLRDETSFTTVVVHLRDLDPERRRAWDAAVRRSPIKPGFRLAAQEDDVLVFEVELLPPGAPRP